MPQHGRAATPVPFCSQRGLCRPYSLQGVRLIGVVHRPFCFRDAKGILVLLPPS